MAYQVSPTLNQFNPLIEEELARRITRLGGKDTTNIEVAIVDPLSSLMSHGEQFSTSI